jgi:hypothetical protein
LGSQGVQGTQGTLGAQGTLGTQGATGAFGGETFEYNYLTNTTDSDPGAGNFKFNNATFSSATHLYIDPTDANTVNITSFLQTVDDSTSSIKGTIKVTDITNPLNYAFFQIVGVHDENAGDYFDVPVAYVSGPLALSNNDNVTMTFARVGDKGDQGIQGVQGVQGVQGSAIQGTQGTDGTQGTLGTQGAVGSQGTQGVQGTTGAGTQGTEGAQGTVGSQGTLGSQGVAGTSPSGTASVADVLMLGGM